MKMFFQKGTAIPLASVFNDQIKPLMKGSDGSNLNLSCPQTVLTLLDCIRVFFNFAYLPHPKESDFKWLDIARNNLVLIYHNNRWEIEVAFHFMVTHALELLETDHSAFLTLQEGVEKQNDAVKQSIINTFRGSKHALQQLEKNLRTKQILSLIKVSDDDTNLIPKFNEGAEVVHPLISPPIYLSQITPSSWVNSFLH